ncbi:MAG: peptide MFS transporter [Bacteroidota bacterium]
MSKQSREDIFSSTVLGHPSGLFVLFFTEMWERFSYYGMRAILVLFLISSVGIGGWDWTSKEALALYGTYTSLVYLTPILGGYLADKFIGYRKAVIWGAIIMTLGHASMALEFAKIFLFIGIGLLIIGNGLFKPNITSIISNMYKDTPEKKDGAYTIFYMGVNAGAFLGIMLCGYLGEKVSWSYGFGLAGIFMLLGMLQFYFAQNIFGDIGLAPEKEDLEGDLQLEFEGDRLNPFTQLDKILVGLCAFIGISWIINDPLSKIGGTNLLEIGGTDISGYYIITGVVLFLFLLFSRIFRYPPQTRDRMLAIVAFAVMTVCFWACFEQAGGSMTIFANDYTGRIMAGSWSTIFIVVNILITVVPIAIITWVLYLLFRQIFAKYSLSNLFLGSSFVMIWLIVFWMINRNLNSKAFVVEYDTIENVSTEDGEEKTTYTTVTESTDVATTDKIVKKKATIIEPGDLNLGDQLNIMEVRGKYIYLDEERLVAAREKISAAGKKSPIISGKIVEIKENEVEIPATWFGILNSLFIIMFAPLFSKWWESKYNPSAATKYGLGLILLGIGFGALAFGSMGIEQGAKTAAVSIVWLILAYLFHTLGELCLSPVSLSYISKLVPGRMIALMFGIWYIAIAIGNKTAGEMGGRIEEITNQYSLTTFFLIFTIIPIGLGILGIMLNPLIKRLMHGVE